MPRPVAIEGDMLAKMIFALGLIVLAVGALRGGGSNGGSALEEYFEMLHRQKVLKATVDKIERENNALLTEISKIKSSPYYAKKVLVDKYNETEQGEVIIYLEED